MPRVSNATVMASSKSTEFMVSEDAGTKFGEGKKQELSLSLCWL